MTAFSPAATRRALVTGATAGVGRAIALRLAADGFEMMIHGHDAALGTPVVADIEGRGGRARFVAANLNDLDDVCRLVELVGDIDVLVNCAGFAWFDASDQFDTSTFDRLSVSSIRAAHFLTAAIAPSMAKRGSGSIISIDMAGGAAKAALAEMTRGWAAKYGGAGVRVNAVAPGPVNLSSPGDRIVPIGDATIRTIEIEIEEIAHTVAFLASEPARDFTGTTWPVDGNWTAF